ncbi:hypothetical protein DFH09DRAFT_1370717 [Mycena vulgaris]|nr:hypothetical protein DFH09DRAFT_1370717 [Mycena vulgaris]
MSAWTRDFHWSLVYKLPQLLNDVTPSEYLLELMRSEAFQESLFLSVLSCWPERGSSYPSDLLELWEDHRSVSKLVHALELSRHREPTQNRDAPTLRFDSIYADILSKNPDLLSVLTTLALGIHFMDDVLEVLGLSYSILRPFIKVRQLLVLPLPAGDSPVDFLINPHRSGELWNEKDSAEEMVLRWLVVAKGDGRLYGKFLTLLDRCGSNPKILLGLKNLNLSELCNEITTDHLEFHEDDLRPTYLLHILNWLRRLPDPPMNVIRVWEEQMLSIELCHNALRRDFGWDSADEDSNDEVYEEGQQE